MVAGQLYTDDLVDSATAAGIAALEPTLEAIGAELDAATSFEDLRERLHALYPKLQPRELSELVYRAMLLGELAGRRAVLQDN
jgi:phage gp29-like protein